MISMRWCGRLRERAGITTCPHRNWTLYPDDVVTVQANSAAIKLLTDEGKLQLAGAKELKKDEGQRDELVVVEAIVAGDSLLLGHSAALDQPEKHV